MDSNGAAAGPALDSVPAPAPDFDARAALEDERDFCLRSLRDLDAERDAGDIEEADYRQLRDAYTARAAAVLRQLSGQDRPGDTPELSPAAEGVALGEVPDDERPAVRGRRRGGWRRRALIALGVVVIAGGAAWSVVASSATRLPGEEITGQDLGSEAAAQALQDGQAAADKGDDVTALKDYAKVLAAYPNQPDALTGEGWILAQTQQPALLQQGLTMLLSAEQADPTYAPAHVYRGIALLSEGDYSGAIPELRWYLAHSPDPALGPKVRAALQQAEAQAAAAAAAKPAG